MTDEQPPAAKRQKTDEDSLDLQQTQASAPSSPLQKQQQQQDNGIEAAVETKVVDYVIYPEDNGEGYDAFDVNRIVIQDLRSCSAKDKGTGKDTSLGDMAFIQVKSLDGSPSKNLKIQTPTVRSSGPVKTFEGNKSSILLSFGKNWEENKQSAAFKALIERIEGRIVDIIAENRWTGAVSDKALITESLSHILMTGGVNEKTGEPYPLAISPGVGIMGGRGKKTEFYAPYIDPHTKKDTGKLLPFAVVDVGPGMLITCIIEIGWVFRRKNKFNKTTGYAFSLNTRMAQAIVETSANYEPSGPCFKRTTTQTTVSANM